MTSPWHRHEKGFEREVSLMVLTLEGRVQEGIQPALFSLHYRLKLGVHQRPVNTSLSLEVIPRLRHKDPCLNLVIVMDVERLGILGEIVQNRVTDP